MPMRLFNGVLVEVDNSNRKKPTWTRWNGVPIMLKHSFMSAVRECAQFSSEIDLMWINVTGRQSSGKSTLTKALMHEMHKELASKYDIPFNVITWGLDELREIEESLEEIKSNSMILFDDVSFSNRTMPPKRWAKVLEVLTKIRHRGVGDVRIVLFFNTHYVTSLDKFLRGADFHFITSSKPNEYDNYERTLGYNYTDYLSKFERQRVRGIKTKYFGPRVVPKKDLHREAPKADPDNQLFDDGRTNFYRWRDPFAPALYFNGSDMRYIIFPQRIWLDKYCGICSPHESGDNKDMTSQMLSDLQSRYSTHVKSAVKSLLIQYGRWKHTAPVAHSIKQLHKLMDTEGLSINDLQMWYENSDATQKRLRAEAEA